MFAPPPSPLPHLLSLVLDIQKASTHSTQSNHLDPTIELKGENKESAWLIKQHMANPASIRMQRPWHVFTLHSPLFLSQSLGPHCTLRPHTHHTNTIYEQKKRKQTVKCIAVCVCVLRVYMRLEEKKRTSVFVIINRDCLLFYFFLILGFVATVGCIWNIWWPGLPKWHRQ